MKELEVRMHRTRPTVQASQRGTALIEFALVLPFLLVLTVCVIDFGRAYDTRTILPPAAREGVRGLAVNTLAEEADVEARVRQVAAISGVTITDVAVADIGNFQFQVTANAEFDWLYPGLFQFGGAPITDPMPHSASAVMHDE